MILRAVESERVYRALLLSYPRRWRHSRKTEEMLGVMLDAAEANGQTRPGVRDAANLIWNGMLARLLTAVGVVAEDVRNRIAQLALISGGGLALTLLVLGEIGHPGHNPLMPWLDLPVDVNSCCPEEFGIAHLPPRLGPFQTMGVFVYLGWLAMLAASAVGRPRLMREIGVLTLALTIFLPSIAAITDHQRPPGTLLAGLAVLNVAALTGTGGRTPRASRVVTWASAIAIAAALVSWRLIVLARFPSGDIDRSRACFYWCTSGGYAASSSDALDAARLGGADAITQHSLIALLAVALAAALAWRWDRTWLAAAIAQALAWIIMAARHHYWFLFDVHIGILPRSHGNWYTHEPSSGLIAGTLAVWMAATAFSLTMASRSNAETLAEDRPSLDAMLQSGAA
jgi:hypothetical protein